MSSESHELLKAFFRRWSTIEITDESKPLLKEDVINMRVMLKIYGEKTALLDDAEFAPDRKWFAMQLKKLEKSNTK